MACPDCGGSEVAFEVPPGLREHAPGGADAAAICVGCLQVRPRPDARVGSPASFDPLPIPDGEAGAAVALGVGLLDSLALEREAVVDCFEFAEAAGGDVLLSLDRLSGAPIEPHFPLDRRRRQLEAFL